MMHDSYGPQFWGKPPPEIQRLAERVARTREVANSLWAQLEYLAESGDGAEIDAVQQQALAADAEYEAAQQALEAGKTQRYLANVEAHQRLTR